MHKFSLLFLLSISFQLSYAQTVNDLAVFLGSELNGTARYNAMAGAFGALGGDLSGMAINPAGSSVFLYSEFGTTMTYASNETEGTYFGERSLQNAEEHLKLDQLGAVFVLNNTNPEANWTRISFGINRHRVSKFDQKAQIQGTNTNGIDQYFLYYADGLAFKNLPLYEGETIPEVYRILGEENGFAAQQAFLGYQSYILNPFSFEDNETEYYSNLDYNQVDHRLQILTKGFHQKNTLNFSARYKNFLHLGVNINIHKLEYHNNQAFFETGHSLDSPVYDISFGNELSSFGDGFSAQLGGLLKIKQLRLGLTYDSPQYLEIMEETEQEISSFYNDQGTEIKETIRPKIVNTYEPYQLKLPSKTTVSAAYIFGVKGLLSVDYTTQNGANSIFEKSKGSAYLDQLTDTVSAYFGTIQTLRIGGEYRLKDISLRGGIFNRQSIQQRNTSSDLAYTAGIGLDLGSNSLSFSFTQFNESRKFLLFSEGLTDSYTLSNFHKQFSVSYTIKL